MSTFSSPIMVNFEVAALYFLPHNVPDTELFGEMGSSRFSFLNVLYAILRMVGRPRHGVHARRARIGCIRVGLGRSRARGGYSTCCHSAMA